MVFFNCGNCGQGVRKNQVEKHLMSCRSNVFSCIDCNKDFYNREYASHNKCITEAEKYESKSYVAKANKGELKQQSWYEVSKYN
jgi:cell growth-regulating nucleolar protein